MKRMRANPLRSSAGGLLGVLHLHKAAAGSAHHPRHHQVATMATAGAIKQSSTQHGGLGQLISRDVARLYDVQASLLNLGVDNLLAVPKLVVCGDQSAGKSSLIQRICGVDLPRASGTCTKCPTELQLIKGEAGQPWRCSVSLRTCGSDGTTYLHEFGPVLTDKAEVEGAVRKAQAALLNPERRFTDFEKLSLEELPQENALSFTKDTVVISITDQDLVNLSLVDLPGILRSANSKEEQASVDLVHELTVEQIKKEETIIVAAISCKTEIENQEIFNLARQYDPNGERTVGVLTKADTIEEGDHARWFGYASGTQFKLKQGYFFVRNPAPSKLNEKGGITREDAATEEDDFFRTNNHFLSVRGTLGDRMGLHNLVLSLSDLLTTRLRQCIPSLRDEVHKQLAAIEAELQSLPSTVEEQDVPDLMRGLLDDLANDMQQMAKQLSTGHNTVQAGVKLDAGLKGVYNKFSSCIMSSRPRFQLPGNKPAEQGAPANNAGGAPPPPEGPVIAKYGDSALDGEDTAALEGKAVLCMKEVQQIVEQHYGTQLPGSAPYGALLHVMKHFNAPWMADAESCLAGAGMKLKASLHTLVTAKYHQYPRLADAMRVYCTELVELKEQEALVQVKSNVTSELLDDSHAPFTNNRVAFFEKFGAIELQIKNQLAVARYPVLAKAGRLQEERPLSDTEEDLHPLNELLLALQQRELQAIIGAKDLETVIGDILYLELDEKESVEVMAKTMAYFQVSSARVSEQVPLHINECLVRGAAGVLKKFIEGKLRDRAAAEADVKAEGDGSRYLSHWSDHPAVKGLVLDDPAVRDNTQRRRSLVDTRNKLKKVLIILQAA